MMPFLAQAIEPSFWNAPNGSNALWIRIALTAVVGVLLMLAMLRVPPRARRPLVAVLTFLAGFFYVAQWLYPKAIGRGPADIPLNAAEGVAFWLEDTVTVLGDVANTLGSFLLGLGVYSLLRVHTRRLFRMQQNWAFSLLLLLSMVTMIFFGYWNWMTRQGPQGPILSADQTRWTFPNYAQDFLFDGLLQQMDAAMFSIIAFYILSAAYRAFRIRSIESTILLATALIVMLSLMGAVEFAWNNVVNNMAGNDPSSLLQNLSLTSIREWIGNNVQNPSLRAIDFGIGIGALAMALRLWLSLEKQGVGA